MAITVAGFKDELSGILHGTNLDKVKNLNGLIWRAARKVIAEADVSDAVSALTLFDGVYDYSPPTGLKERKVIDIRPVAASRTYAQSFGHPPRRLFDLTRKDKNVTFSVEEDKGTKKLRVSISLAGRATLNDCDSLTANGTWTATNGGSNIALDENQRVQGSGSIRFDVGATGGGIINSTIAAVDLSTHQEKSSLFLWVYFPDSMIVTSVDLRWGSDSATYWSRSVTAPHIGSFQNGWNLIRFDWNGATQTGTVTETAIDFVRVNVVTTAADTDLRVDEIVSCLPHSYEIHFYSEYLFRTSSTNSALNETITNENNIINLLGSAINLLLYETAILAAQQLGGANGASDIIFFRQELYGDSARPGLYSRFRRANPSEAKKVVNVYYEMR